MKRIIAILCVSLLSMTIIAQGKFTVPSLTDLQKYRNAALQWNGSYMIQISYARSLGKSVDDVAGFVGDQLKTGWSKDRGYSGFVQGILYYMVCLVPYGSVEITEQTDKGLIYKVTGFYSDLKEGGQILNVTYEEYIKFWEIVFSRLADYMGAEYFQKDTDEGLIVTVRKN